MLAQRTYADLTLAWRGLRGTGVTVREIACWGVARTLLVAEYGPLDAPAVHIVAGVHGDEPAAPWALLSVVADGLLDRRFSYRMWPCLNPSGYEAGRRENAEGQDINRSFSRGGTTPEARAVLTANRDRRFVLALDMHEDFEARGAYVYEPLRAGSVSVYASRLIAALDDAGLPVQHIASDFDLGAPDNVDVASIYQLGRGTVLVDYDAELRVFSGLPSSIALMYRGVPAALTIESPRPRAWDERLAVHRVALTSALTLTSALSRSAGG